MKRRLKGAARCIPGFLYALLMFIPFAVGYGVLISSYIIKADNYIISMLLLLPLLPIYLILLKIGKKIFDFTERIYLKRFRKGNDAYHLASVTELAIFFGIIFLITFVPVTIEARNDGKDNSSSVSESINSWD